LAAYNLWWSRKTLKQAREDAYKAQESLRHTQKEAAPVLIADKYRRLAIELAEQGKTGHECAYCGNIAKQMNRHGTFCAGCGAERPAVYGICFGVPVYDAEDAVTLMRSSPRDQLASIDFRLGVPPLLLRK
jgi:hypothetical protein